jgi:acetyltransferase (GNAT) family protein
MMVVATRHARQGLGARLMRCALEQAGDAIVYLTATSDGRPLYERLGSAAIDSSVSYRGRLAASAPSLDGAAPLQPVTAPDLPAIAAVDRVVFGADRGTRVIGPLVARDAGAAAALIVGLAAGWSGASPPRPARAAR